METQEVATGRSTQEEIMHAHKAITSLGHITQISDATNTLFMILDENRQIVYANEQLIQMLGSKSEFVLGQRPGEMLDCINASKMEAGCGEHDFCRECGAFNAIVVAQKGQKVENECRISSKINDTYAAFDLSVQATPFYYEDEEYVLFSVTDISDKKRREVLEGTFFHDILNTAGGLIGLSEILKYELKDSKPEYYETAGILCDISDRLVKEIQSQRMLMAAESKKLQLCICDINLGYSVPSIIRLLKENKNIEKRDINLMTSENITIYSDPTLLQRVLLNMMKNAAEASLDGQVVTVNYELKGQEVIFSVHNETWIDEATKHQIFQRSFSTKGFNRGIGTYSMKLFSENYLKGRIWFESSEQAGTTFYLALPLTHYSS